MVGCTAGNNDDADTLVVWDPFANLGETPEEQAAYEDFVAEVDAGFAETHPGVTIKHSRFGYDGYTTKLAAAVAANKAPDIAWDYTDINWKFTDPIDDLLTGATKDDLTLTEQSIVSAKDGKLHILPFGTYQGVWLYNKALFEQAGIEPPTTQEEWLENCDTLNEAGITPTKVSFNGPYKLDRYVALYATQFMPDIAEWNNQSLAFDGSEYSKGLDALMEGLDHACFGSNPESTGIAGDTSNQFRAGTAAMMFNAGSIRVESLEADIGVGNVGVMLQPALEGGKENMDASLQMGLTLVKTSKNKDLAWEYMEYFVQPENQALAWDMIRQTPNSKSAAATSDDPVYAQLLEWGKDPQFQVGAWPVNPEESFEYAKMAPAVVAGNLSTDEFLTSMQAVREKTKSK
ncbi:MAG: ABC transporter substrate-binding protein [Thermomicrobiales bacterium]